MSSTSQITTEILTAFGLSPEDRVTPVAGGHINRTFAVNDPTGRFIVQRINHFVFPSPENIMENTCAVTEFIRRRLRETGGDPDRETLTVRRTTDGADFFLDQDGEYWRCMTYISGASAHETADGPGMLLEVGRAFGNFQKMLSDYPADTLHEIIPRFHDTPERFRQLEKAMEQDVKGRKREVGPELEFAVQRKVRCGLLMELLQKGELPLRVTHNDTKMSNVLIDDATGQAVCVIDLDTVMPGLAAFDFGDSIRAGATTAAEDETDLSRVHFDLERYEAYTRGFLSAAGSTLTQKELDTLPDGAILMTFEVGIRFLADYLNGDVYYHTDRPRHNLGRARNQFRLVEEMEQKRAEMSGIIARCMGR